METYIQPHEWKALAETFRLIWLYIYLSLKKIRTTPVLVLHPKQICTPQFGGLLFNTSPRDFLIFKFIVKVKYEMDRRSR